MQQQLHHRQRKEVECENEQTNQMWKKYAAIRKIESNREWGKKDLVMVMNIASGQAKVEKRQPSRVMYVFCIEMVCRCCSDAAAASD